MDKASIQCNEQTPLQHVSVLNSGLTTEEQLKICCKPTYKTRRLKNKGAILILVWNYLLLSISFFNLKATQDSTGLQINLQPVALGITLPIAGWLADVYFGRYVVIQFSMWTMWIAFVLLTASSVVAQFRNSYKNIDNNYVRDILMAVATIGLGGFQANIIQFGVDQLHDASTNEITSFITWYVWTNYVAGYIVYFVLGCIPSSYWIIRKLVMCIHVTAALVSMFHFSHLLVKEPVTKNPFKLVYNVVKYAIKNKHPRCRSAFTFCEDDLPSRIDFGKSKYGGPFTTEQVEDVKTFLRMLAAVSVASVSFSGAFAVVLVLLKLNIMTCDACNTAVTEETPLRQCYLHEAFNQTFSYSGVLVIPIFEFLFFPVFHRFLAKIESQRKFILGVLLLIATIVTVMGFEAVTEHNYLKSNTTTTYNMLNSTGTTALDYRWLAIPSFLNSMSVALLGIGGIEFIVSQAPYSMRGLIMGIAYGMWALSSVAISIPFTERLSTEVVNSRFWFWYTLLLLIMELSVGILLILTMRWYKKRKREDVLPNEHIFAERYYGRES